MTGDNTGENEQSNDQNPNRRAFLRTVGATAGSAAILGNVGSVTAANSGPFAPFTREKLSGDAQNDAVKAALADEQTKAVLAELPGGANRLDTDDAQAYQIVNAADDSAPITQVLIPVLGRDATLGYASADGETAVGLELEDGRYLQSIDHPAKASSAVEHKHVAQGQEKREILDHVTDVRDLAGYDKQKATVNVVEESATAYVQIPVSSTGSSNAADSALIATVDLNSQDVTIQGETTDCVISCLATSPSFWGICWTCCCQWCWSGLGCVACAGCVGITLAYCGGQCA